MPRVTQKLGLPTTCSALRRPARRWIGSDSGASQDKALTELPELPKCKLLQTNAFRCRTAGPLYTHGLRLKADGTRLDTTARI